MRLGLGTTKFTLMICIVAIFAFALVAQTASAKFALFDINDGASDKKDKAKSKEKKDDDDDDDDDDDEAKEQAKELKKREKEEKKRAEKAMKSKGKSLEESASAVATIAEQKNEAKPESKKSNSKKVAGPLTMSDAMETINATVETDPVPSGGDAADDPAIWINRADPSQSTIIGSDKQGGLAVYDLSGKQLQYVPDGMMDNVDLRDGFSLGGEKVAIVTASNRKDNSIAIYKVNAKTRMLEPAVARNIKHSIAVYGNCMYSSAKTGKTYYFGTSKSGEVEQFELFDNGGKVDAKSVRRFKVGGVVEGCVADDEQGQFYVSEEAVGIWKYGAEPDAGANRTQVDKTGSGGNLVADVEGLAIAYGADGKGYLFASSQGNYSYVVYRREGNNEFVKKFRIGNGDAIDGAEETDGLDVTTANLGPAFPNGLLVVQDGFNDKGNQNFKLIPLQAIIKP